MTYKEEITKLIRASYDQGVADAKQEALAELENTVAVMVGAGRVQERQRSLLGSGGRSTATATCTIHQH